MYLPGYPCHVIPVMLSSAAITAKPASQGRKNYRFNLELWKECIKRYGVQVHAWCLMTNHIRILVTPVENDSISRAMRVIGSRYSYYYNNKYKRSGALRVNFPAEFPW